MLETIGNEYWTLVTTFTIASLSASYATYLWSKKAKNLQESQIAVPEKWVKVGNVKDLILYPIKSCSGINLKTAYVTSIGLSGRKGSKAFRDRIFLLVDSKGVEYTQGRLPKMILIQVSVSEDDKVTVSAPNVEPLTFSMPVDSPATRRICHIGTDKNLPALDCGDDVGQWFEKCLGKKGLHLVTHVEGKTKERRDLTTDQKMYPAFQRSDIGVFQNETAYLLIAQESITELNYRLDKPMTDRNFRPTVLLENIPEPFAELKWSFIKVGDDPNAPILHQGRPCDRCRITTNDPWTGIMDPTREPLKTLKTMDLDMGNENANTLMKGKSVMGVRVGLVGDGRGNSAIRVGDPVYAALL